MFGQLHTNRASYLTKTYYLQQFSKICPSNPLQHHSRPTIAAAL